jgi:hypothetical protein
MATTYALSDETEERVRKLATKLGYKKLTAFVSAWVNEGLDALESDQLSFDSPLLRTWRTALGKPTLGDKIFKKVCSLMEPANTQEVTDRHWQYLLELLQEHEGPLSAEMMAFYWKQAADMTKLWVSRERERSKIQAKSEKR